jgi:hypothetical protein
MLSEIFDSNEDEEEAVEESRKDELKEDVDSRRY